MNWLDSTFRDCFRSADEGEIYDWAAKHVELSLTPWAGKVSLNHTPWLRHPLESFRRKTCHWITIVAASGGGKSLIGQLATAWLIANNPGFTCWYFENENSRDEASQEYLSPILKSCAPIKNLLPSNRHHITIDKILFPHMPLLMLPANESNSQRKHFPYLFCDEGWLYKPGMRAQITKRTAKFAHNRKIVDMSTGSNEGDEIDELWKAGTMREWQFRCPECRKQHVPFYSPERLDMPGGLRWDRKAKVEGKWDYKKVRATTYYECPQCRAQFEPTEENGYKLNRETGYTEAPASEHESYHWNGLVSDFRLAADFAVEFLQANEAKKNGFIELMIEFVHKREARAWAEKADPIAYVDSTLNYTLGDPWPEAQVRICTIDNQKEGKWVLVNDWCAGPKKRLVYFGFVDSWDSAQEICKKFSVPAASTWVDTRYDRENACGACCRFGWGAIQGESAPKGFPISDDRDAISLPIAEAPRYVPANLPPDAKFTSCDMMRVSREITASALNELRQRPGWTTGRNTPESHKSQLNNVHRVKDAKTGKWEYQPLNNRSHDHAWDLERYSIAVAFGANILQIKTEDAK